MQYQDKDKIAYYAAITIFFSAIELFIPKPLPFFRLGIANIPILLSLDMRLSSFLSLLLLKSIGSSYISGNIFSIFALVSIAQTFASGLLMYILNHLLKNHISRYGLSMSGAIISTYTQIGLASLYIGSAIKGLLAIMLPLSLISSLFVAFVSYKIMLPEYPPNLEKMQIEEYDRTAIITLLFSGMTIMMTKGLFFALIACGIAFFLQKKAHRKIKILPHVFILFTMVVSSLLTPMGKVLISIGTFAITSGALIHGLEKGVLLSAGVALSQAYSQILKPSSGLVGTTLSYFTALISSFRELEAPSFTVKIQYALSLKNLKANKNKTNTISKSILISTAILFVMLFLSSRILQR